MNHPNRSGRVNPEPPLIRETRESLGLTQTEAGGVLHTTKRVWQQWEAGERRMHPAFWELFQLKTSLPDSS